MNKNNEITKYFSIPNGKYSLGTWGINICLAENIRLSIDIGDYQLINGNLTIMIKRNCHYYILKNNKTEIVTEKELCVLLKKFISKGS